MITTAPAGRTLQFRIDGKVIAGCGAVAIMRRGGRAACKTVFIIPGDYQVTVTFKGGPGTATGLPILRVTVHSPVTVAGRPRVGSGVVTLLIGCAPGSGGCRLSALLGMAASGSVPGGQTAGRLGRASVRIPAGRTATLGVRLNPAGRALLAKRGILTVVQTIVLDLASRHIIVSRTTVTLRATPRASSQ